MNNNSNNYGDCGTTCSECGRPWAICKQDGGCGCNKCKDIKFCEYGRMANGCIREKQPGCPMQAVIPSVTVESIEGIKNLADCLVHVSDINTTFYIDDKHRPIITWAGPIDIPGYDMEGNPNNYRDQIVTDVANQIAVIYDKSGKGYLFGLAENIDLQEQVNNKLDEMAQDGTLQSLIDNYLVICGGNAKELGCAGDGVTDDTTALQDAVNQMHTLGINKLVIPSGEFVVSGKIDLPSNFELKGMKGSVIKYVGMGADGDHPYAILPIINIVGSEDLPKANVTVEDITIDCTGQTFKGGRTFEDPANTNPQPASQGLRGIDINFAINTVIKNCRILDLYGDGIRIDHSHTIIVDGNILNDVGGGNIVSGGPAGWDNFGDGIVSFSSFDVKIINNTVINTRKYLSGDSVGYICGRSGLEYEYGLQNNGINTPGQELFVEKSGNGLVLDNNYVYGYTKGIHLESSIKCIITNNTVIHNNIGMMNSTAGRTVISGNYFNQDDVGPAYQSGYDGYYGGVAVSEYVSQYSAANCVEVNNNIFDGDSTGVHIGRDYVSVNNNTFRGHGTTYGAVRTIKADLRGLSVNCNQFFNCGVHLYHTRGGNIADNVFDNTTNYCVLCEECDNTNVTGNEFNHRVTFTSNTFNISITGNTFYAPSDIDASYTQMLTIAQTARNALIEGNNINLVDNNDIVFLNITGSINARIKNNNIRVSSSRTAKVIYLAGGGRDIDIESNVFIGCGYKATLISSNWDIIGFTLINNILDEPTSYLYSQTGGGIAGQEKIEHNIGNLSINSNANSTARLTNRFIQQGDIINRYIPDGNNVIAYYCSQGGYYVSDSWTASTPYKVNKLVKHNDYVYKCLTGGTATVAPTNTTIGNDETGADGVKWVCVSKLAKLRNVVIS